MIQAGALVDINHSGGKDSQAMTNLLSRIVARPQLVAVHAPLGEVEWPKVKRTALERAAGYLYRRADGLPSRARQSE